METWAESIEKLLADSSGREVFTVNDHKLLNL